MMNFKPEHLLQLIGKQQMVIEAQSAKLREYESQLRAVSASNGKAQQPTETQSEAATS